MTTLVTQDAVTGLRRGPVRWPDGTPPPPFGCRRCGNEQEHHGASGHRWERPTNAQVLARMRARRKARAEDRRHSQSYVAFCRAVGIFNHPAPDPKPVTCDEMNHNSVGHEVFCELVIGHDEDHDTGDGITWPREDA